MSTGIEYYGPTCKAVERINVLLALPASGREQDWEIEFADPAKIKTMLGLLEKGDLDRESRSALWLLILASFEVELDAGQFNHLLAKTAAGLILLDSDELDRMRFYWLGIGRTHHSEEMKLLLSMP